MLAHPLVHPIVNPLSRGVGMPRSGGGLHPLTQDYISRLQSAGGHLPRYDHANDYLIRELVKLGGPYWDTMGTLTTLCAKGFDALMVPLRDGMGVGTSVNFVSGDFNAATGLKGDGSSKKISSGILGDFGLTDNSLGIWITETNTTGATAGYIGNPGGQDNRLQIVDATSSFFTRNNGSQNSISGKQGSRGYIGMARSASDAYTVRLLEDSIIHTAPVGSDHAGEIDVFARGTNFTNARLSLYHISPGVGINLETLDTIFTEFMARVYAASGIPLHPLTLDYIARLQAAGGHLPQYDKANDYLIRELSALGGPYWDTMGTLTTLCAKGFDALMVPLRVGMNVGTSVNFVSGDFNATTGLKGNGSTKYINSNRQTDADSINSQSFGAWATEVGSGTRALMGVRTTSSQDTQIVGTPSSTIFRQGGRQVSSDSAVFESPGYIGLTRLNSTTLRGRVGSNTVESVQETSSQNSASILVFTRGTPGSLDVPNNGRFGLYHIGPGAGIDLETLDTIFTEFMARVAAAS